MSKYSIRPSSLLVGLMLFVTACGQQKAPESAQESINAAVANPAQLSAEDAVQSENTIEVQKDATIDARFEMNQSPQKFTLKAGDTFDILKIVKDSHGEDYAQIMVVDDAESRELSKPLYVAVKDLKRLELSLMDAEDPLDENGDDVVTSDDDGIVDSIPGMGDQVAMAKKKKKPKGKMTYCYRYVKNRLLQMGLVKEYLPGVPAYGAAKTLPKYGFWLTGRSQKTAKLNDVCVYRGGKGGNGHIEIRTSGGWWYGYGTKKKPINLATHPFLGCFHKGP